MANYEAHARTRTVGPRTQHGLDRKEQATSHSKNTTSMYVAMLISVTKASMYHNYNYLCRDRSTAQRGPIRWDI